MHTRDGTHMKLEWGIVAIAALLLENVACAQTPPSTSGALEFIRVAADQWTFEGASSGTRFIPFGSNLVWHYPAGQDNAQGLDILVRSQWDPVAVRRAFVAARSLHHERLEGVLAQPSGPARPSAQRPRRVGRDGPFIA